MKEYDVVVIGAGNGGLTAALTLCTNGKKTLLLERHNVPGGFATSFVRGRFEFEASLHELCDFGVEGNEGNLRKLFKEFGILDKVDFVTVGEAFRVITLERGEDYTMPFGVEAFIAKMEEYVPGSRESMKTFFDLADETADAIAYLNESRGKPDTNVLKAKYPNFMRTAAYSVDKVLNAIKMPKKAQAILGTYWSYLGASTGHLGFAHYAIMVRLYIKLGAQIPKERSHSISMALSDEILKRGGEIWYSSEVSKVLTEGGHVSGVELSDGTRIKTSHVISNAMPHSVYGSMMEQSAVPQYQRKKANWRQLAGRGTSMFLGLNRPPEALGLTNYSYFIYHSLDSNKEFELMKGFCPGSQVTVCLNNAIKDCSPPGTTIMYFTTLSFSDCFGDKLTKDNYFELKDQIADKLISTFEKATGLTIRPYIEEIEVGTPVTYAHYTGSPEGTIYGYLTSDLDNMMPRLMTMYSEMETPGLRFAGGHAVRSSGYNSSYLSGQLAANLTLADMKEERK